MDLASSLEARFGVRSPIKRKNLESSCATRSKNWDIIPGKRFLYYLFRCYFKCYPFTAHQNSQRSNTQILGSYLKFKRQNLGYLAPIFLEAKFGAPARISEANFGGPTLPPTPNMKAPPGAETQPHCDPEVRHFVEKKIFRAFR